MMIFKEAASVSLIGAVSFVFFVFLYSLFTIHFLDCGLWEIWLDVLIFY